MAIKGKAAKSSSGASMSKYDVEVEARLQAQAAGNAGGVATNSNDTTADHEKLLQVEAALNKVRGVIGV